MCVAVTMEPGTDLTLDEVVKMDRTNADGVGVAWARNGRVEWFKTTNVDPAEIHGAIRAWRDYPRLVHFRLSTAGGTRPDLCHPFEVGPRAKCDVKGHGAKVMIHNGHWNRWNEVKNLLDKEGLLPDDGPWSDSRLAAYLAYTDPEWFAALGGRVAVMGGDGGIMRLGDWSDLRPGIKVSNKLWESEHKYKRGGYSGYRNWKGWNWTEEEMEQFLEEEEEREKKAIEEAIKADEEQRKQEKAARKAAKREQRRIKHGKGDSVRHSEGPDPGDTCGVGYQDCHATPPPNGCADGPCQLPIKSAATRHEATAFLDVKRPYDPKPWQNTKDGRWYQIVNARGFNEVVEIAAPSTEGAVK